MTTGSNIHIADSKGFPVATINNIGLLPGHEGEHHDLTIYILDPSGAIVDNEVITFSSDELAHLIHGLADYGAINGLHINPTV